MAAFLTNLGLLASQNHFLAYFIIYLVTIFLGNISAFASFWLVFQGALGSFGGLILFLIIIASDITGDILWYSLGRTLRNTSFGNFVKNHLPRHDKIEKALHRNARFWIFLSKYIYAASFPIIFMVGWSGIEFKKFWKASLISILTWVPILTLLAYGLISGISPLGAVAALKQIEKLFLISIGAFIAIDFVIARIIRAVLRARFKDDEDPVA